jgi:hypothetical protein
MKKNDSQKYRTRAYKLEYTVLRAEFHSGHSEALVVQSKRVAQPVPLAPGQLVIEAVMKTPWADPELPAVADEPNSCVYVKLDDQYSVKMHFPMVGEQLTRLPGNEMVRIVEPDEHSKLTVDQFKAKKRELTQPPPSLLRNPSSFHVVGEAANTKRYWDGIIKTAAAQIPTHGWTGYIIRMHYSK